MSTTTTAAKIKALAKRPGTEGEGQAAKAALVRVATSIEPDGRQRLTAKIVGQLPVPAKGNKVYRDAPNDRGNDFVSGFGIRVTAGGNRSFVLNYTANGVERRKTIGPWPLLSVEAAREAAKDLAAKARLGEDPLQEERDKRGEVTVAALCDLFVEKHVAHKRPATVAEYTNILNHDVLPKFGKRVVTSIKRYEVADLHRAISKRAPVQANRVLAVLGALFSFAIDRDLAEVNPCSKVERNYEAKRTRYLSEDELRRLHAALVEMQDQDVADMFRLMLLTGARTTETRVAKWSDFDLDRGEWLKPARSTKQKRDHLTHLSPPAVEILRRLRARHPDDKALFPGIRDRQADYQFNRLRDAAKIANFRKHDLRHCFASATISAGFALADVGALIGHSNPATTARYSHLLPSRLKEAAAAAGAALAEKE
jgi:integrase